MQISEHTALVTGGASGLGEAVVRHFHQAGANVVLVDLSAKRGHALQEELGERSQFIPADVSEEEGLQKAVRMGVEKFGAIHIAVCCAGIGPPKRVLGKEGPMALDLFSHVIQVNLIGTFNTVRLAAEAMATNPLESDGQRGVIVMTSSVAAFEGQVGQAAYSASKGGIISMTLPMAREFAALGIRVMTIAPGLFDTPLMAGLPEETRISLGKQVPFPNRLGRPREFAQLVGDVVANPMLNGEVIRLDGAIRMAPR